MPVTEESKFTAVKVTIPDNAETNKVFIIFPFLYEKYKRKSKYITNIIIKDILINCKAISPFLLYLLMQNIFYAKEKADHKGLLLNR